MSKDTSRKVATSAIIAGIIGYIAGVLTAPKSGRETRKDIKDATIKAKTEAEKKFKEIHSELKKKLDEARKKRSELTGKARDELDKVLDSASDAKEKVREILSALHEGDASDPELKKALNDAKTALKHLDKYVKS